MQLRSVSGMNIPQGHRPVPITIGWSLTLTPFDQQPSLISTLRTAVPRYHMHSPPRDATIERSPLPCVQLKLLIKTLKFEHRRWYIYIPLCCVVVLYWTLGLLLLLLFPLFGPRELLAVDWRGGQVLPTRLESSIARRRGNMLRRHKLFSSCQWKPPV